MSGKALPEGALPITETMVPVPGPYVEGLGDLHGVIAYESIKATRGMLRDFFLDYGRWTSGWLADDERLVGAASRVVLAAYRVFLPECGYLDWDEEMLSGIAYRASRETLDQIHATWTTRKLMREMRKFYESPKNARRVDRPNARRLLSDLRRLRDFEEGR